MKAQDLAYAIIDFAQRFGTPVSNMLLNKLMFFCAISNYQHGFGRLIEDAYFEAWPYGPFIRDVYIELSIYGADDITDHFDCKVELPEHLQKTLQKWLPRGPWEIEGRSHIPNGAWARSYNERVTLPIREEYIKEEALTYGI